MGISYSERSHSPSSVISRAQGVAMAKEQSKGISEERTEQKHLSLWLSMAGEKGALAARQEQEASK